MGWGNGMGMHIFHESIVLVLVKRNHFFMVHVKFPTYQKHDKKNNL